MDAEQLRGIALFAGLSDEELASCSARFQDGEILAGSGLAKEGEFAYKFFVVIDGEVDVLRDFDHVATLGAGDFFGEMGLVSGETRNARVQAKSRCQVAWMMPWDFQAMTEELPAVAARIEATIAERMGPLAHDTD